MKYVFVLFSLLSFFSIAQAQYSQERITLGILKGRGYEVKGKTPSGYQYSLEFLKNDNGDLILDAFVSRNQRGLTSYTQRFSMNQKQTNEIFPKFNTPAEDYPKFFSQDGFLFLVTQEETGGGPRANLVFIELNKEKIRVTFQYDVQQGYRANGAFTEAAVAKTRDPKAGRIVVTTDWIEVDR